MTIDELIDQLREIRNTVLGDTPVDMESAAGDYLELRHVSCNSRGDLITLHESGSD